MARGTREVPGYCTFCANGNHAKCKGTAPVFKKECECGSRAHDPSVEVAAAMYSYLRPADHKLSVEERATRWRKITGANTPTPPTKSSKRKQATKSVPSDGPVKLTVPGVVYSECFDRNATVVPAVSGWPEHIGSQRRGRGVQYVFEVTPDQRDDMIDWAKEFSSGLLYGVDPECAVRARQVMNWCEKEEALAPEPV